METLKPLNPKLNLHPGANPTSIFNVMHSLARHAPPAQQAEQLRGAVVQWSMTYSFAYALNLTIAFALLTQQPSEEHSMKPHKWRPESEVLDTVVSLLYYIFSLMACIDSAWGMLLCCEWGVRSMAIPANLYEEFASYLEPKDENLNSMWVLRILEPRLPHFGQPHKGFFTDEANAQGIGFTQSAAWDPFYFIDRTVQMQLSAILCLMYMNAGLLPCMCGLVAMYSLYHRVRYHCTVIVGAMFATMIAAETRQPGGVMANADAPAAAATEATPATDDEAEPFLGDEKALDV